MPAPFCDYDYKPKTVYEEVDELRKVVKKLKKRVKALEEQMEKKQNKQMRWD